MVQAGSSGNIMAERSASDGARPDRSGRVRRRAALGGALVTAGSLLAVAGFRGLLDGWFIAAGLAAVAIAPWLGGVLSRRPPEPVQSPAASDHRFGVAEAVLAHIPDPVILVDGGSLVVEMNAAARRLLPALRVREPLSFALRSPDVLDGIHEVVAGGETLWVHYAERVPTERAFEVLIGPLQGANAAGERIAGVVLFFRDLTEARRLENMRVDFVANASHELRTPLASLLGFIETLQGLARDDPVARERFLEIMREQANRMTRLIDDLLSLSRIEMRVHVPPRGRVDLVAVVRQIAEALAPLARERGVEIRSEIPDDAVFVTGDKDELLRVVENLVENAVKYGESGRRVDIGLASSLSGPAAKGMAEIVVRDYGPGIASEHIPRLTERFYRVDVAQSRQKGGTGLGLAIVKHIVNRHKGSLSIESQPGEGASFKVSLPIGGAPPA